MLATRASEGESNCHSSHAPEYQRGQQGIRQRNHPNCTRRCAFEPFTTLPTAPVTYSCALVLDLGASRMPRYLPILLPGPFRPHPPGPIRHLRQFRRIPGHARGTSCPRAFAHLPRHRAKAAPRRLTQGKAAKHPHRPEPENAIDAKSPSTARPPPSPCSTCKPTRPGFSRSRIKPHPSPTSPANKTTGPSLSANTTLTLELMTAGMARITIARPTAALAQSPQTIHIAGADPCFGLGERFYQAALSNTHFDVRPADRSGEPGHNWSYVAIPLVYTPTGLGLYADTVFDTNFQFNAAGSAFDLRVANTPVTLYFLVRRQPQSHPRAIHRAHRPPRKPAPVDLRTLDHRPPGKRRRPRRSPKNPHRRHTRQRPLGLRRAG